MNLLLWTGDGLIPCVINLHHSNTEESVSFLPVILTLPFSFTYYCLINVTLKWVL